MRCALGLLVSAMMSAGVGCMQARYVLLEADGGAIAIPHNSNAWPCYFRDQAETLMKARCPQGYLIEREEEVVVGQTVHTDTDTESSGAPLIGIDLKKSGASLNALGPVTEQSRQTTSYTDKTE